MASCCFVPQFPLTGNKNSNGWKNSAVILLIAETGPLLTSRTNCKYDFKSFYLAAQRPSVSVWVRCFKSTLACPQVKKHYTSALHFTLYFLMNIVIVSTEWNSPIFCTNKLKSGQKMFRWVKHCVVYSSSFRKLLVRSWISATASTDLFSRLFFQSLAGIRVTFSGHLHTWIKDLWGLLLACWSKTNTGYTAACPHFKVQCFSHAGREFHWGHSRNDYGWYFGCSMDTKYYNNWHISGTFRALGALAMLAKLIIIELIAFTQ